MKACLFNTISCKLRVLSLLISKLYGRTQKLNKFFLVNYDTFFIVNDINGNHIGRVAFYLYVSGMSCLYLPVNYTEDIFPKEGTLSFFLPSFYSIRNSIYPKFVKNIKNSKLLGKWARLGSNLAPFLHHL